jgi:hypothetical protein
MKQQSIAVADRQFSDRAFRHGREWAKTIEAARQEMGRPRSRRKKAGFFLKKSFVSPA